MSRIYSFAGVLTLSHLALVVAAILFSRSLAGPVGFTRVDLVPAHLMMIRDIAIIALSLPIGWLFLLPTHLHGPDVSDIAFASVGLGLNSLLVGYVLSRILRRRSMAPN